MLLSSFSLIKINSIKLLKVLTLTEQKIQNL